ncbi:N-acetylmuramoyl-L-alanine amidase [Bifidobacterium animalis subsp. animalis]|uniref:peptidoglycan recognition protein family protein n=1 Tax=Bifidobacterium animalis TaxID=28025 RepID=UPI00101F701C|nr:N-acetylmuramoyl-L-alanine amidase [Bifidobacterium animalis]RYN13510.1 N-acetylmuramoyl-L-alanine amidase [Bifidobacterium animalis subsp. animalis]
MKQPIWVGTPNYTPGRSGWQVDHITLHIMAGFLAGTDSTFQVTYPPERRASATYGIGADGTIHQYVRETDTPWSDSNSIANASGISIEHEGGIAQARCTRACMDASAELCADIARRYGWKKLWHSACDGNIYLHREIPGTTHTTCPDLAPNGLDVNYIINKANKILAGNNAGGGEEPEVVTDKDIDKIVHAVWEYRYPKDKRNLNMYNKVSRLLDLTETISSIVNPIRDKLKRVCDMLLRTDSTASGMLTSDGKPHKADLWTRLDWMDKRLRDLTPNPRSKRPDTTAAMHLTDDTIDKIVNKVLAKLEASK